MSFAEFFSAVTELSTEKRKNRDLQETLRTYTKDYERLKVRFPAPTGAYMQVLTVTILLPPRTKSQSQYDKNMRKALLPNVGQAGNLLSAAAASNNASLSSEGSMFFARVGVCFFTLARDYNVALIIFSLLHRI